MRYLVVGGYAVGFHSKPRYTKGIDVWVEPSPENASRVWTALAVFGAPLTGVTPKDFETPGLVYQIGVPPVRIDIPTRLEGVDFTEAWKARVDWHYGDVPMHVLSKSHLIANKRVVGRPQDPADIKVLERMDDDEPRGEMR